jgi:MFS superfamily sulfate permease-like transporter
LFGGSGEFDQGAGKGDVIVLYALFMLAVLAVLYAFWREHRLALPSFLVTLVVLALFLASDMTSPLTLSF